jgi:arylsulfatase A-like enzyme
MQRNSLRWWRWLVWAGGIAVAAALLWSMRPGWLAPSAPAGPQKLNVIIVLSDALRAANLPLYGYPRNTTPHLSELARESIVFDTHFAHYPGTSVSVSQIHSGRLMSPLLMSYRYMAVPVRGIPPDLLILPREFHAAGYRTGIVSSHYWLRGNESPLLRFYDSRAIIEAHGDQSYAAFEDLWPSLTAFLDGTRTDDRPFFLYVHALDTHGPATVHPGFEQFQQATDWPEAYNRYDSTILYTDHWVGKLVDELRRRRLLDHTVFVFTADHGEEFNEMGPEHWNSNHGPFARRVLMHVPLLLRLPGDPAPGRRYQGVTRHIDLAPTLLRLAIPGFDLQPYRVDGDDLSGELLHGGTGADTHRLSIAYTPRYWGIFDRDVEVHYDQWTNTFSPLYRFVRNTRNYPVLEPVDDAALRARLVDQLSHTYEARTREFMELPENTQLPSPTLLGMLLPVMGVEHDGVSGAPRDLPDGKGSDTANLTFENAPDDNRWALGDNLLECQPTERPAPLTLFTPWVSGTYRVAVLLSSSGRSRGYENQFQIQFLNDGVGPQQVRGADATNNAVDLGIHTLGSKLEIRLSEPHGGVAIDGLRLERINAPQPTVEPDDGLREHLRALGYVH